MKLIALHDEHGHIIAATKFDGSRPTPIPVQAAGLSVVHIELEPHHAAMSLDTLCAQMRVDVESRRLIETDDKSAT